MGSALLPIVANLRGCDVLADLFGVVARAMASADGEVGKAGGAFGTPSGAREAQCACRRIGVGGLPDLAGEAGETISHFKSPNFCSFPPQLPQLFRLW